MPEVRRSVRGVLLGLWRWEAVPHGCKHRCKCTEEAFLAKLNPEQLTIRENCNKDIYPKGACPIRDMCPTADLPCYGSMCDDCANTCKGGEGGHNFSIGACDRYVKKGC